MDGIFNPISLEAFLTTDSILLISSWVARPNQTVIENDKTLSITAR